MTKVGYCVTCNKSFPLEVRVAGKTIALAATALLGTTKAKLPWWFTLLLGLGSLALASKIDEELALRCPTPTCRTVLKILDATMS